MDVQTFLKLLGSLFIILQFAVAVGLYTWLALTVVVTAAWEFFDWVRS